MPKTVLADDVAGGVHCETTAVGVLLRHGGLDLSEAMLFGLGAGLSFIYWDSKQQAVPFLGGRVKPFLLTRNLTERLGLDLRVHETTSARKAWDQVRGPIDEGMPVGLQLDSYHLEYFSSRVHFAGHVVALYGYDDHLAYLVDTEQQGGAVSTSLESLARARAERGPMAARNRSFTIHVPQPALTTGHLRAAALDAMAACATEFLTPPITNLGHRGIRTAAKRLPTWLSRVENPSLDLPQVAMLMERAGTGGALFRHLYRDFLTESLQLLDVNGHDGATRVEKARDLFAQSALLWTDVARLIDTAGTTGNPEHLTKASQQLEEIAAHETAATTALAALKPSPS